MITGKASGLEKIFKGEFSNELMVFSDCILMFCYQSYYEKIIEDLIIII